MKKIITTLLLLLVFPSLSKLSAQTIYWENHNTYSSVQCMLDLDTSIVVGSNGGVTLINKSTGVIYPYYDKVNSPLSGEIVNCLEKGEWDYVWMGTDCGLGMHLNGIWENFNSQNTILPSDCFSSLFFNIADTTLWVGLCDGNVATYHNFNWNLVLDTNGLKPASRITSIVKDSLGNTWVGTINNGVYKYDGFNWINFDNGNSPVENTVRSLALDNTGKIWVANSDKLVSYDTSWVSHVVPGCSNLRHMSIHSGTNLIFLSSDCGLISYNGTAWNWVTAGDTLTDSCLIWHVIDNNYTWTGTKSHGVDKVSSAGAISNIPLNPDLKHRSVSAIDIAANSTLHVGYSDIQETSLSSLSGPNWTHFNPGNTTALNNSIGPVSALQLQSTKLWIATYGSGIYTKSGNTWASFNKLNSNVDNDSVTALAVNSINSVLVGYYNGAVQVKGQFPGFTPLISASQIHSRVNRIFPGSNAKTWVATDTIGLVCYQGSGLTYYNKANSSLPSNKVLDVKEDANHLLWISTDSGLVTFDGTAVWTLFNTSNSPLPTNNLSIMSLGKDSSMWIGTKDAGIVRFKNNTWTIFDQCNSKLTSNNIQIVESANNGKIYAGTDNGLSIISFDVFTGQVVINKPSSTIVYPNPGTSHIRFEFNIGDATTGSFRLYDIYGQLILSQEITVGIQGDLFFDWDLQNYRVAVKPGLYYFTLDGNFEPQSGKVIVAN